MLRPSIGKDIWVSIITGLTVVVWSLLSPIGTPQALNAQGTIHSRSGSFALAPDEPGALLTSTLPDMMFLGVDHSVFIEQDEDKSFCSFYDLGSPTFITSDWPSKALSGPLPGNLPSRTVAVPLRC